MPRLLVRWPDQVYMQKIHQQPWYGSLNVSVCVYFFLFTPWRNRFLCCCIIRLLAFQRQSREGHNTVESRCTNLAPCIFPNHLPTFNFLRWLWNVSKPQNTPWSVIFTVTTSCRMSDFNSMTLNLSLLLFWWTTPGVSELPTRTLSVGKLPSTLAIAIKFKLSLL